MKKSIKFFIVQFLEKLNLYSLYSLKHTGPLYEDGWFRSYQEKSSIDASGNPIPWITYPAIDFIRKRLNKDLVVFEFGSGGSTRWWANQVRNVVSVEHDRAWYEKLNQNISDNVVLKYVNLTYGGDYSKSIQEYVDCFDIVVVDGRDRVDCLKNCINSLKVGGVVILDNSDRVDYAEGVEFMLNSGFKKVEFTGFCPIVNFKSETAIFYRINNIFGM